MAQRLIPALQQILTATGQIAIGYKLKTYATGTTTPLATYSDEDLTIPNANPATGSTTGNQIVNFEGYFGDIWVNSSSNYKAILTDVNDNIIETPDPVDGMDTTSLINLDPMPAAFWGTTAGTSTAYTLNANPNISSIGYSDIQTFLIDFHVACGASPTLSINGLTPLNLKRYNFDGTKVALASGDVQADRYWITNDGVDLIVLDLTILASQAEVNAGTNAYKYVSPATLAAKPGLVVQVVNFHTGATASGTTQIPSDDTIPQITEGDQYMSLSITPQNANNYLKIDVVFIGTASVTARVTAALFQDSNVNALAAAGVISDTGQGYQAPNCFSYYMNAGTTSPITFTVRAGADNPATIDFNGVSGRQYGGVCASSITITEIAG
jgi:hypothetical protein